MTIMAAFSLPSFRSPFLRQQAAPAYAPTPRLACLSRFTLLCLTLGALLDLLAPAPLIAADTPPVPDERAIENLAAFARAYGYVRFFHPSDQAAVLDWDRFALFGATAVRDAADDAALRTALREVFAPFTQGVQFLLPGESVAPEAASTVGATPRLVYWQHHGVQLSKDAGSIYRSRRVPLNPPLFDAPAPSPATIEKTLTPRLRLRLPLALPLQGDSANTAPVDAAALAALQEKLAAVSLASASPEDWHVRVAGIVIAWNVFQHFHPYLDQSKIDWAATLRPALQRTLRDRTRLDYYQTLAALVARLDDGHGYVYGRNVELGGLPIRTAVVEGHLTITGADAASPFRKGDVLLTVDGTPALDVLAERERYVSGSPHLRRYRALNQFGEGPVGSTAIVELERDGRRQTLEHVRARDKRGFFFNPIGEFEFPALHEVRPGIWYVNLGAASASALKEKLPALAAARGVIFDERFDGRMPAFKAEERISVHRHIIPHLIGADIQASPMLTPRITQPDRQGWTYRESTWPVTPLAPRLPGRIVFINEPPVVSYGETCMAMISHYKLATLVGEPTAGCNGNANFIELPARFRIMWTGMDVLKHDRTPFYGVGFTPDHPVPRTLAGVKAGRDEFLAAAIAVIESTPSPANPAREN